MQRVLYAPAVHYKGKGFYATDYGRKGANGEQARLVGGSESGSKDGAAASSGSGSRLGLEVRVQGSDSKSSDSKSSSGDGSSSKKSDASKPAA